MNYNLNPQIKHLFVLGAGSSVDYGLPTWGNLAQLIEKELKHDMGNSIAHEKEILAWLNKVGLGNKYKTIDECITAESRSREFHSNGLTIENQIFLIMKLIFDQLYKNNEDGWINKLNRKILNKQELENEIAFVNYNYDNVLNENLLQFDFLTQKEREVDYRGRISQLNAYATMVAAYPHGNFYSEKDNIRSGHLYRHIKTNKTELESVIDAISCYESDKHSITKNSLRPVALHILGLGGGLQVNLKNIDFKIKVSEIHITIHDTSEKENTLKFLSEFFSIPKLEIKTYPTCDDLIENSLS